MSEVLLGDVPARNAERLGPDRWAVRHDSDVLGWGELADRSLRRAHALAGQGVGHGDTVLLALPNCNDFYELTFAIWKLGATPAIVSHKLRQAELGAIVEAVRPRVLIGDTNVLAIPSAFSKEFGRDHPDNSCLPTLESPSWKMMTSGGSTGRPKVIVDHHSSCFPDLPSANFLPSDGVILNAGPLYHNVPFANSHVAMLSGSSVVGMPKFDAEKMLQLIERHQVQWISLVPTMMNRIARLPAAARDRFDLSSLETVWHTAAPITQDLKEFWINWLGPERIWEVYGGSEGFGTTQLNGTEWLRHRGSVGRPRVGELLIRGEDGRPLQPGQIGEVYIRGAAAGATYHYIGAESNRLPDGFDTLGDFGWVDDDGYLYIADRRADLIICGGSNVYPAEVEAALMAHPAVETAVVIGLPDDDLGAVPHAIVQLDPNVDPPSEAELRTFVSDRLQPYKTPRSYEFTTEPLRDEAGKVRRAQVRAERLHKGHAG